MVQPFQITNVKAGSKYIIMYMYKTREYFTPFTFIWKKSVYWSSFAIWQEKSWDNVTKQLGPCLITLHKHSSQRHLLCRQSKQYSFSILQKEGAADRSSMGSSSNFSEFVTFLPLLTNVDQILNYWGNCTMKGKSLLVVEEMVTLVKLAGWKNNGENSSRGHPAPLQ